MSHDEYQAQRNDRCRPSQGEADTQVTIAIPCSERAQDCVQYNRQVLSPTQRTGNTEKASDAARRWAYVLCSCALEADPVSSDTWLGVRDW